MEYRKDIKIRLTFEGEKEQYFSDVTSLFYDLELLYDFSLVLFVEDYHNLRFSHYFLFRKRGIKDEHKLRVKRIIKESPLAIELALSSVAITTGAIWVFIQAFEKISNYKLNREKLELEVEKLREEKNLNIQMAKITEIELENKLETKEALRIYKILLKRFEKNPIKPKDMDFLSDNEGD
jgi:hypothetical protein